MSSVPQILRRRRRRRAQKRPGPALVGGVSALAVLILLLVIGVGGVAAAGLVTYFGAAGVIPASPQAPSAASAALGTPSLLLDRQAQMVIYEVSDPLGGARPWVTLDSLPDVGWQAAVAIEDGEYWARPGFSLGDAARLLRDAVFGGSFRLEDPLITTLTRQVLLPPQAMPLTHPDRPFNEAVIALELRRRFSREQLLEWFLNTAFYGNGAYGIEAAARTYFGKGAAELTLGEAALLAGIPDNPTINPFDQPDAAHQRQEVVLGAMVAYGLIAPDESQAAAVRYDITRPLAPADVVAPHYALAARRQAEQLLTEAGYDGARLVAGGGLRITTTLDLELQYQAECALRTQVTRLAGVDPAFVYNTSVGGPCDAAALLPPLAAADVGVPHALDNGAVVILRPESGEVLAYVGSMDYWNADIMGHLDSAARGYPPGSMLLPYVYLQALADGYPVSYMLLDVAQTLDLGGGETYEAVNLDGGYRGPLSMRQALLGGSLPAAAQMMNLVGPADVIRIAHKMGLNTLQAGAPAGPARYDLALLAGGGDAALADLVYSFSVFANLGQMVGVPVPAINLRPDFRTLNPVFVVRIEDSSGAALWEYQPATRDTLAAPLAYLMNHVLGDRQTRIRELGADNIYEIGRPAAVFAGGSADGRALWTVGYTPQVVVGMWLGSSGGDPTRALAAASGPAALWRALMLYTAERYALPVAEWPRPAEIVEEQVCAVSGLLPNADCPTVTEIFAQGTQPTQVDTFYETVEINRENGRLATANTPANLREEQVYFNYPPEARAWAEAQGIEGPPTEYDNIGATAQFGLVAILSPTPLTYVGGTVEIRGNATWTNFNYYRLDYGQGLNPGQWFQIGEAIYRPARNALLGTWDTSGLDGLYSLRLRVITGENTVEDSIIQLTIDNTPPEITVIPPGQDGEVRLTASEPRLDVGVVYSDNVGVTQVDYYLNGAAAASVLDAPFAATLEFTTVGTYTLYAEAYDDAGNVMRSAPVNFSVARGP